MKRRKDKKKYEAESEAGFSSDILRCDQSELYLTNEDIEKLNDRYEELYKKVKNSSDISVQQQELEQYVLLHKYAFEIVELSKEQRGKYLNTQTKIEVTEGHIIPFEYRGIKRLFRRIFRKPLQNKAQDIVDTEAELNAKEYFRQRKAEIEQRAAMLNLPEQAGPTETSEQSGATDAPADVLEQEGTAEQPVEEPKKRRRRRTSTQATAEHNEIRQEADDAQALTPTGSDTTPPAQLPGQINIEDIK